MSMKVLNFMAWQSLLALAAISSVSQAQDSACLNQLIPCLQFINSDRPPSSVCCEPLKSLIRSDPRCLCSLLGSNSAASRAGHVNMTRAQLLPARCGEKASAASCKGHSKGKASMTSSAEGSPKLNYLEVLSTFLLIQFI